MKASGTKKTVSLINPLLWVSAHRSLAGSGLSPTPLSRRGWWGLIDAPTELCSAGTGIAGGPWYCLFYYEVPGVLGVWTSSYVQRRNLRGSALETTTVESRRKRTANDTLIFANSQLPCHPPSPLAPARNSTVAQFNTSGWYPNPTPHPSPVQALPGFPLAASPHRFARGPIASRDRRAKSYKKTGVGRGVLPWWRCCQRILRPRRDGDPKTCVISSSYGVVRGQKGVLHPVVHRQ